MKSKIDKNKKKKIVSSATRRENQFGVVLEDINSKMEKLEREISDFKKKLNETDEKKIDVKRFEKLEKEFYELKSLVMERKRAGA